MCTSNYFVAREVPVVGQTRKGGQEKGVSRNWSWKGTFLK